ncbi:16070_t:CDS:2, partial [Cetraspora pellucida]
ITQDNLCKKTLRARKLLMLFGKDGVGIDKIKQVTYSANEISKLTNVQIQNIINQVTLKTISSGNDQTNAEIMAPNKNHLYQYAIEHGINSKEFSIITGAEKNRWTTGCFRRDLERDIRFYRDGIERKEDSRKYYKFLTDQERLVSEELLYRNILKSGLSTAWLDNLIEEWEKIYAQFIQISFEEKTLFVPRINVQSLLSKSRPPISVLSKDPEERQQHVIEMLPPTISVSPTSTLTIGIRCPLARSWIGRCLGDIIVLGKVTIISHRGGGVITRGGGIISLGGGIGVISCK